jgi:hypothetical protein
MLSELGFFVLGTVAGVGITLWLINQENAGRNNVNKPL